MQPRKKRVYCPVCNGFLGEWDVSTYFRTHCNECATTFWWKPRSDTPIPVLDREHRKRFCGCGCGR